MNKTELKNLLNDTLLGEQYDPSHNACVIARIIREKYPQFAPNIWTDYNAKENTCFIKYRAHRLIGWKMTKTRGEYKWGYNWTIKSITLFDWFNFNEDLQERFIDINKTIENNEKAKQERANKNVLNFKKIRALFPALSWYEFECVLDGVKSVSYEQIKKEQKQ